MPQVICTSKHAKFSAVIGGVKFFASDVGRISEEITAEQAEEFLKTPTFFQLHMGDPIEEEVKKPAKPRAAPRADAGQNSSTPSGMAPTPAF